MRPSSAKAKGRRAAAEVVAMLHRFAPWLQPGDINVTPSGVTGEDVTLSPAARKNYPFAIECKNVERLNVWEAFEQAKSHSNRHLTANRLMHPILFFRKNHSDLMVCMKAEDFFTFILNSREQPNPEAQ